MTPDQVRARVEEVRDKRHDDEAAHAMEDDLWGDVLRAIGDGAENPAELAKAALETLGIKFCRWCA